MLFHIYAQNRQTYGSKRQVSGCLGMRRGPWKKWGVTANLGGLCEEKEQ